MTWSSCEFQYLLLNGLLFWSWVPVWALVTKFFLPVYHELGFYFEHQFHVGPYHIEYHGLRLLITGWLAGLHKTRTKEESKQRKFSKIWLKLERSEMDTKALAKWKRAKTQQSPINWKQAKTSKIKTSFKLGSLWRWWWRWIWSQSWKPTWR